MFRRGDGTVTDRDGFVAGLTDTGNQTRELVANVAQILEVPLEFLAFLTITLRYQQYKSEEREGDRAK